MRFPSVSVQKSQPVLIDGARWTYTMWPETMLSLDGLTAMLVGMNAMMASLSQKRLERGTSKQRARYYATPRRALSITGSSANAEGKAELSTMA